MRSSSLRLLVVALLAVVLLAPSWGRADGDASAKKRKLKAARLKKAQAVGRAVSGAVRRAVKDVADRIAQAVGGLFPAPAPASSGGGSWGGESAGGVLPQPDPEPEVVAKDALSGLFASGEEEGGTAQDARSVHLHYPGQPAEEVENRVVVLESTPGSYFCVCGFDGGYLGMQELADGRKVAIFSVWDAGQQDDPDVVPEERQVRVTAQGPGVEISRFGNEGTGAKSMVAFSWRKGVSYRFRMSTRLLPDGRTAISAWVGEGTGRKTRFLATMEAELGGRRIQGLYSFVEDFRRDGKSAGEVRKALFHGGWIRPAGSKERLPIRQARFTAWSPHPSDAIDAGLLKEGFYLQNGGDTKRSRDLDSLMSLP